MGFLTNFSFPCLSASQLLPGLFGIAIDEKRGAVDEKKRTQLLRRYWLIGQTLDGMRVWDIRRAIAAMKTIDPSRQLTISASGEMGIVSLYAAIFEPAVSEIALQSPPVSHNGGPQLLNVLKVMDVPQAAAMAAGKCKVRIISSDTEPWKYPHEVANKMGYNFEVTAQK